MLPKLFALTGTALLLAGAPVTTAVYECDDGTRLTLRTETGGAWLFLPEKSVELPPAPTETGHKYADENITFWYRGENGLLLRRGQRAAACTADPQAAEWEAAKLDGADFRAADKTGRWELLLFNGGEDIVLTADGNRRYVFKNGVTYVDKRKKQSIIRATTRTHALKVTLTGGTCKSQKYDTAVIIVLDGKKKFAGCGRALH